jgi:hypothetical protein
MAVSLLSKNTFLQSLRKFNNTSKSLFSKDPFADNLRLAVPLNESLGVNDYSASIKGYGTNKTGSLINGAAISTSQSKFYGSSVDLGLMTQDRAVSFANTTDFYLGTNDFTIEGWWYPTNLSVGYQCFVAHSGDTGDQQNGWIIIMESNSTGPYFLATNGTGGWPVALSSNTNPNQNSWNHIAVTRRGDIFRIFLNGVQTGSISGNHTNIILPTSRALKIGNYSFFPGEEKGFQGYAQDFRMYVGVAKYTTNFSVPDRI